MLSLWMLPFLNWFTDFRNKISIVGAVVRWPKWAFSRWAIQWQSPSELWRWQSSSLDNVLIWGMNQMNFFPFFLSWKMLMRKPNFFTNFLLCADGGRWKISYGWIAGNQEELYVARWPWIGSINYKRGQQGLFEVVDTAIFGWITNGIWATSIQKLAST